MNAKQPQPPPARPRESFARLRPTSPPPPITRSTAAVLRGGVLGRPIVPDPAAGFGDAADVGTYPGGKSGAGVYQRLINEIPPHDLLVVAFAGRCGVTRRIRPASRTVIIDRDPDVLDWWDAWQRSPHGRPVELHEADGVEWLRYRFGLTAYGPGPREPAATDPRAFVFMDPPYVLGMRSTPGRIYRHEMTDDDHRRLVDVFGRLPVPAMLCGYESTLYRPLDCMRIMRHQVPTRGGLQAEAVWMNYATPARLHDHRFIGDDRRERERVRRRQRNVLSMLARMSPRERAAMLETIQHQQRNPDR